LERCGRAGHTFVTYGPLIDFTVEGKEMGSRIEIPKGGATLQMVW